MFKNTVWLLFVMMVTVPGMARADHNPTPIAVPLLGTQGTAGPYGSSIQIVARGGPTATGSVGVRLLGVTHPCPEDLAVLLVHGADKHLLLSNAGSCRPLQGTTLIFNPFASPVLMPDTQPGTPAYGASLTLAPSNYGAQPSFPAPAPAGPYTSGCCRGVSDHIQSERRARRYRCPTGRCGDHSPGHVPWVFDDLVGDSGQITSATLMIDTETFPRPTLDPSPRPRYSPSSASRAS